MVLIPRDQIKYFHLSLKISACERILLDLIPTAMSKLFIISAIPPVALLDHSIDLGGVFFWPHSFDLMLI
jgi:hypothetical protein